jgi:hypothetical protein
MATLASYESIDSLDSGFSDSELEDIGLSMQQQQPRTPKRKRKRKKSCWERYKTQMKPRDSLRMTAWQKWKYYRRPPWKAFLSLTLLILTTVQVLVTNEQLAPYTQANNAIFEFLLAPENSDDLLHPATIDVGYDKIHYIYQTQSLLNSLNYTTWMYFNIHNVTVDYYKYPDTASGKGEPPMTLVVEEYAQGQEIFNFEKAFTGETKTTSYELTEKYDLGPFAERSGDDLIDWIHTLRYVTLRFTLQNYDFLGGDVDSNNAKVCFEWETISTYDFTVRGRIEMKVDSRSSFCPESSAKDWWNRPFSLQAWLFVIIIILASIFELLIIKSLVYQIKVFALVKEKNLAANIDTKDMREEGVLVSWESLSWADKLSFFNVWFLLSSVANICNIAGAVSGVHEYLSYEKVEFDTATVIFIASGCLFSWITIIQYVEGFATYYVLITTLRKSLPRVAKFLVGVMPVFLGYGLFGVSFFGMHSESFSDLDQASVTLFSLLNGDSIYDIFAELEAINAVVSRIYLYSFITLFIYAVLNVFIAIVEDAFFASKAFQLQSSSILENNNSNNNNNNNNVNGTPKKDGGFDSKIDPKILRRSSAKWGRADDSKVLHLLDFSPLRGARPTTPSKKIRKNRGSSRSAKPKVLSRSQSYQPGGMSHTANHNLPLTRHVSFVGGVDRQDSMASNMGSEYGIAQNESSMDLGGSSSGSGNVKQKIQTRLTALHRSAQAEFETQLQIILDQVDNVSPPHDEAFYPCQQDNCLYCKIRNKIESSLITSHQALEGVVDDSKTR